MAHSLRVLLADSDGATRNALALLLRRKWGLRAVGEAADGATFTRALAESQPELVLLVWALLDRPGLQALQDMRRAHPHLRLAILSVDSAHAAEAEALNAVFIHKGSAAAQVLEQLRALVEMCPG